MSQADSHHSTESARPVVAGSGYLNNPLRSFDDARSDRARAMLPLVRQVCGQAKALADTFGRTERRFGSHDNMHMARLADDLWMAADNFVSDVTEG